jgi:carbamoyltransferase
VLAALSEERMVGFKNVPGYPQRSIDRCLELGGVTARDLDVVALASFHTFTNETEDYVAWKRGDGPSPFPRPLGRRRLAPLGAPGRALWSAARWWRNRGEPSGARIPAHVGPWEYTDFHPISRRIERVVRHLDIDQVRVKIVDHHRCHASYAFLASPWRARALVMVADQVGDYVNASVWRTADSGELIALERNYTLNSLGRIYSTVTGLLGMRPLEDEHKVMGLAAHASFESASRYLPVFENLVRVKGIGFVEPVPPIPCWTTLPERLRGARFDAVAGAVQLFLEKRMGDWVMAATRQTGLDLVALSGGIALNVKANRVIGLLTSVKTLHVPPAGGDECLAIGAAQAATLDAGVRPESIPPLGMPYLGDVFSETSARRACEALRGDERFRIIENEDRAGHVARRLAEGWLVARFAGRMEFGPRALGNRSILADAFDPSVTSRLNRQVKHRDFWMPFAPVILAERADCYFENPKGHDASTMTIAFRATERAKRDIPAALHPADGTLRPQVVDDRNASLQQILRRFEALTGRGALLNTSFNRHREPIVHTPEDAVRTFVRCDLDILDFDYFLVERVRDCGNA